MLLLTPCCRAASIFWMSSLILSTDSVICSWRLSRGTDQSTEISSLDRLFTRWVDNQLQSFIHLWDIRRVCLNSVHGRENISKLIFASDCDLCRCGRQQMCWLRQRNLWQPVTQRRCQSGPDRWQHCPRPLSWQHGFFCLRCFLRLEQKRIICSLFLSNTVSLFNTFQ